MPCNAMQKISVRKGCMFRCACEPPALRTVPGSITFRFVAGPQALSPADSASKSVAEGVLVVAVDEFTFHP